MSTFIILQQAGALESEDMKTNDKCPHCGSTEIETVYVGELVLNVCKVCQAMRSKNWF
jgi:RNA polymerase subunit RPABC4/transcription elongation factor Spt4